MTRKKKETVASKRRAALNEKKQQKLHGKYGLDPIDQLESRLKAVGIGQYMNFETCESTNDELKTLAKSIVKIQVRRQLRSPGVQSTLEERIEEMLLPDELPLLITTDEQTAGRGRQNNRWWSGKGTLAMSMLIESKQYHFSPALSGQLSLAIGYAVMRTIRHTIKKYLQTGADTPAIEIRWPNDVYVNDRKISGILIEAPTLQHLVIGVGVNTNCSAIDAPVEIQDRVVTLRDLFKSPIDQHDFIVEIAKEIMGAFQFFPNRIAELIEMVEKELHQIGKQVTLARETGTITGKCLGLNHDASLRVQTEIGIVNVVSGVLQ